MGQPINKIILDVYNVDGTTQSMVFTGFEQLQEIVGGLVEPLRFAYGDKRMVMVVNEEGFVHDLPLNLAVLKTFGITIHGRAAIGPESILD